MKTNPYLLEKRINAALAAMPSNKRQELSNRRRVQSVAYAARGMVEAADTNGNVEMVPITIAAKWINQ